jgi:Na+-driven multidrug efflux pump
MGMVATWVFPATETSLTPEQQRFEKYGAVGTVLLFAVGPLMFNTGISFHDAVDLFWISRAFPAQALHVVGFATLARYLCLCVAIYYSQSCMAKVSSLMGENKIDDATLSVTDLFRLSILTMLVIPVIFYFITRPLLIFMGCTTNIADQSRAYLLPFITTFQLSCGFLQSEVGPCFAVRCSCSPMR